MIRFLFTACCGKFPSLCEEESCQIFVLFNLSRPAIKSMADKAALNEGQKTAFKALQRFVESPGGDSFILKGYAGTGKTFLVQHFAKWLDEKKYAYSMLAATGRAAAVLRGKTGMVTRTVHSELYHFNQVSGADDDFPEDAPFEAHGQLTLQFTTRLPDAAKKVYIIDESSLLSSEVGEEDSIVVFGSGNLLVDLFEAVGGNKVIFVGDPGQLPPIGQAISPALDMEWLASNGRTAVSVTLDKIERTTADNDILVLASMVRNMADRSSHPRYPKLPANRLQNVHVYEDDKDLFRNYLEQFRNVGPDGTIAIGRTNEMINIINRAIRRDLYGNSHERMKVDDVLLVTHNNALVPLANGDFVTVIEIGVETMMAALHFQSIKVKSLLSGEEYEILISLDILYGPKINFTKQQNRALMIDFNRRMKKRDIKVNSDEYKGAMLADSYLNCLRAKYGYAVTCHKSQGGEWDEVYLFLEKGMFVMPAADLYRWWYTSITRAKKNLHIARGWWIS
ncbi:MAG: DUF2075 domain-containing protein [Chitinophagaceae bacterium]|nr:MAG: DUF2075 domain-containing protein [Chitinophagaceae bacterium]